MAEETKDIAMYDASVQSEKSTESSSSSSSENDSDGGSESAHAVDQVELYLNKLGDESLLELVKSVEDQVLYYGLENEVFENFLMANEPTLISGMGQILDTAGKLQTHISQVIYTRSTSSQLSLKSIGTVSMTSSKMGDKGPRINLSQRTDLVLREVEVMEKNLQTFIMKMKRKKAILKAELEEIGVRQNEINDAIKSFENTVVLEGLDPLTGRIPAEKFIKYMQGWLKNAQFIVEKMRLRLSTAKDKYNKTRLNLVQKEELGETIREVDFQKIIIENQKYIEKIEQKNIHLLELKKMTGSANLVLSTHKKFLLHQVEHLKKLRKAVTDTKIQIEELRKEGIEANAQVETEKSKYEHLKKFIDDYKVPDVLEYVKLKNQVHDLRREAKIWTRKCGIQKISMQSNIKEMKKLTGVKQVQAKWMMPSMKVSLESLTSDEFPLTEADSDESVALSYVQMDFQDFMK